MNERIYVALDVETTGLRAGVDEIIEVAAVKFRNGEILERYNQLVCPHQPLPLKITRLTGITPEDVATAPRFNEIGADVAHFIKSYPLVGHSVGFDLGMLRAQGMTLNQTVYDTFDLATLLMPQIPVYKLGAIAEYLGIPHPADHRALNDAEVTAQVFTHLLALITQIELQELNAINNLIAKISFPMRDLFVDALHDRARNAFTDHTAPRFTSDEDENIPLLRPTNAARWISTESLQPTNDNRPIDLGVVTQFFAADGALGRTFPGYELREPQVEMARSVTQAFNRGVPLIVEAGTGTGKSLAYLVPAALFAAQRGERVVVSTNTINLQDQLFFKDIPDLQAIMVDHRQHSVSDEGDRVFGATPHTPPFTAALLKGRSNYLCIKRYHDLRRNENLLPEEVRALLKVQLWLPITASGDKSELLLIDREAIAWSRMNVTQETCTGQRCKHFPECFFFQARRRAEAAHIVVVNHALLVADLAAESNVLPAYDHLVIDEAHNLEDVTTDQFSFTVDQAAMFTFLDTIYQEGGVLAVSGVISDLLTYLNTGKVEQAEREKITQVIEQFLPSLIRARVTIHECFSQLVSFVTKEAEANQYDSRLRLTTTMREKEAWVAIQESWQYMLDSLASIDSSLSKIHTLLQNMAHVGVADYDELVLRFTSLVRFAQETHTQIRHIIFGDTQSICWISQDRVRNVLILTSAPLSVAETLQTKLFEQKKTAVLTSATLTIEGRFDFVRNRIGMPDSPSLILESPFDYEQQALVFIPNDIPEPNQRGYQQAIEQALIELCGTSGGRTLALFTANSALKQTYAAIQEPLEEQQIAVLGQGIDGSRRSLLDRFKEFPRTVLLGTNSFWEGVDVVGDALSVLVIAKLPFAVPTDPIYAARSELFDDPFGEYSVPLSILKFKQGFGRLIRSREDRGIVVVLDKRLISKKYGQKFLDSLPHTRVRTGPLKQLPAIAAKFLS